MIGETIGHFKIVSRLGSGGMGAVYAGEHESIQTRVAIKVLHSEVSRDTDHVQRFFNEAKIVGRIKHSGIVKIFDVGFFNEQAYLVMELLEGESLSARIERVGRIPWAEGCDLARQIASVLDATHRAGVIHRDLKPDNIFLVHDHETASGERVKILDFGISKLTSATLSGGSPKTVGTMGTPQYMAPEQWGDSGTVDWRADAYSLGCVAMEMVTGAPPFECRTIADACAKHLTSKPPAPSSRVPELPSELDELILRLLAKDPAERAVSMGQIKNEFAEIAGKPVSSPGLNVSRSSEPVIKPQPTVQPSAFAAKSTMTTLGGSAAELETPPKPNRVPLFVGIGVAVALAGVLGIAMMSGGKSKPAKPEQPEQADPAETTGAPVAPPDAQVVTTPATPPVDAAAPPVDAAAPPPDAAVDAGVKRVKKLTIHKGSAATGGTDDDEFGGRH
ncbi:MAG TPA: serine/threonine-protein kinase [Kofleriaceae bacterium]|nr:serine/threonine-protein kinase [Kofleriaceae bacterium]